MNREIKFRTWDNGKMLYNVAVKNSYAFYEGKHLTVKDGNCQYTIMQYSGINDRNENQIYEGDLCRLESGRIVEVKFKDGGFGYDSLDGESFNVFAGHNHLERILLSIEIIGNIFENKNLIK